LIELPLHKFIPTFPSRIVSSPASPVSYGAPYAPAASLAAEVPRVWTPKSLLDWTDGWFASRDIPTPRLDAELLLAYVLGLRRLDLYLQFDRPLDAAELTRYRELVRKRADRVPVAYLTGEVGFWNLTLDIAPGCLIPRPDTETLVEAVLDAIAEIRAANQAANAEALTVLELGIGSAAIPLALCSELEALTWIGVDRAPKALSVAARNVRRHAALLEPRGNRLGLVCGDGFDAVRPDLAVDLIVSNPPYILSGDIPGLMPEVAMAEPRQALDGGPDGLRFYHLLIAEAARPQRRPASP
jgi:release factor glutamine methyltransferase